VQRRKGWWEDAACQGVGTHIFFPVIVRGDCMRKINELFAEARSYCERCPVRLDCLTTQIKIEEETGQHDGMWGGLTPYERKGYLSDKLWAERTKAR